MKRASSAGAHLTTVDAVELNFEWWLNSAELKAAPLAAPKSTPCMHGRVRVCRQTNESPAHVLLRWKFFRKLITTALCREQQIKLCRTRRERRRAAKRAINRPAALCYYCRSAFANLFPLYCSPRSLWNGAQKNCHSNCLLALFLVSRAAGSVLCHYLCASQLVGCFSSCSHH